MDTLEEQIRLEGWPSFQKEKKDFEKERLSDIDDVKKDRKTWAEAQKKALLEYRAEKSKQVQRMDESISPEYQESVQDRLQWQGQLEKSRRAYVQEKISRRREQGKHISLSEEYELGLVPEPERVPWQKRGALASKYLGSASAAGSSAAPSGGGSYSPPSNPSPPPPPPPDFFEPEIPPPPPPPEFFDSDVPPPPPLFEGEEMGGGF